MMIAKEWNKDIESVAYERKSGEKERGKKVERKWIKWSKIVSERKIWYWMVFHLIKLDKLHTHITLSLSQSLSRCYSKHGWWKGKLITHRPFHTIRNWDTFIYFRIWQIVVYLLSLCYIILCWAVLCSVLLRFVSFCCVHPCNEMCYMWNVEHKSISW